MPSLVISDKVAVKSMPPPSGTRQKVPQRKEVSPITIQQQLGKMEYFLGNTRLYTDKKNKPFVAEGALQGMKENSLFPTPFSEGYFTIPNWRTIADSYGEAVATLLAFFKKTSFPRNFEPTEFLYESAQKLRVMDELSATQGTDIIILQAQFGIQLSSQYAVHCIPAEAPVYSEFNLGVFEILVMLLIHPERVDAYQDLWIDAAGDIYQPCLKGLRYTPYIEFYDGGLYLDFSKVGQSVKGYAFASGFY